MFKRVERKRRKREEEEEMGLDEETKEILGMHDTDSDESESESGQSSEDEGEQEEEQDQQLDEEASEDDEDDEEDVRPQIPIHSALLDPLYVLSLEPQLTKGCISLMHAHIRRFKQFSKLAAEADPNRDAWIISDNLGSSVPNRVTETTDGMSKRAAKKKARSAFLKEKHVKRKAVAKAKKEKSVAASTSNSSSEKPRRLSTESTIKHRPSSKGRLEQPPQKKQKVADTELMGMSDEIVPKLKPNDSKSLVEKGREVRKPNKMSKTKAKSRAAG
ncbi:hypothetical protein D9758_013093 [Tetrapyrgos nigripes]|uniref:Uncharacterized protein n=1 Tax=Tetrapyrgos nigripes TaxID=182062 RepID=A0A8H5FID1_9AGAR|nr:hypothetical protein D9758_013093 [Tetrapyrgos nigripes]